MLNGLVNFFMDVGFLLRCCIIVCLVGLVSVWNILFKVSLLLGICLIYDVVVYELR